MKTLIIDNFDSFTYNIYQYVAELGGNPVVFRNNEIALRDIERGNYTHIIISPGPGTPEKKSDFGICEDVINRFSDKLPILGICLGHQGIIHALGGKIIRSRIPVHGKRSQMRLNTSSPLFKGLPVMIEGMRYHSLVGEKKSLPPSLRIIAETTKDKLIMAISHKKFPLFGVQFHPESIGTKFGKQILKNFLNMHYSNNDLNEKEAENLLIKMASGKISEQKMEEILIDLADKRESVSEIIGAARAMRRLALPIKFPHKYELMDTCGTGGSGHARMNISTTAAFVLAACGVKIAKHGNRAASGRCGSFDLLEALGITITMPPKAVVQAINELNLGFIFAPMFHPAMKKVAEVRKKIGRKTIFNLLGPLTNPAKPKFHLLGTSSLEISKKLIESMKKLGYTRAMVVTGEDGLDDITLCGKTKIYELNRGKIRFFEFSPEEVGMKKIKNFKKIAGGSPTQNAKTFIKLLKGKAPEAMQNLLYLNTAFALAIREIAPSLKIGIEMAARAVASGAAYKKFLAYKEFSNLYRPFQAAIRGKEKIKIIAEIKRRSPSYGKFPQTSVKKLITAYEKGGASALSVVTDPKRFDGSLELLKEMYDATNRPSGKKLPIIRKDFITNTNQIDDSKRYGASAILLIACNLSKNKLAAMANYAQKIGLEPVVELHDKNDINKIKGLRGIIIGINNRNLKNLKTDINHAQKLIDKIHPSNTIIIESGFKNAHELAKYSTKADAALIGQTLLTAKNPLKKLLSFTNY